MCPPVQVQGQLRVGRLERVLLELDLREAQAQQAAQHEQQRQRVGGRAGGPQSGDALLALLLMLMRMPACTFVRAEASARVCIIRCSDMTVLAPAQAEAERADEAQRAQQAQQRQRILSTLRAEHEKKARQGTALALQYASLLHNVT